MIQKSSSFSFVLFSYGGGLVWFGLDGNTLRMRVCPQRWWCTMDYGRHRLDDDHQGTSGGYGLKAPGMFYALMIRMRLYFGVTTVVGDGLGMCLG
jgi:hypothetical protein